jgi:hypothetical protein
VWCKTTPVPWHIPAEALSHPPVSASGLLAKLDRRSNGDASAPASLQLELREASGFAAEATCASSLQSQMESGPVRLRTVSALSHALARPRPRLDERLVEGVTSAVKESRPLAGATVTTARKLQKRCVDFLYWAQLKYCVGLGLPVRGSGRFSCLTCPLARAEGNCCNLSVFASARCT